MPLAPYTYLPAHCARLLSASTARVPIIARERRRSSAKWWQMFANYSRDQWWTNHFAINDNARSLQKKFIAQNRRNLGLQKTGVAHFQLALYNKKHLKNVGPIRHCEPPHAACFTLSFTRCRYCRTPPAHRCPQQHRQQRQQQQQRVTEGTAMAPWNGPNKPKSRYHSWHGFISHLYACSLLRRTGIHSHRPRDTADVCTVTIACGYRATSLFVKPDVTISSDCSVSFVASVYVNLLFLRRTTMERSQRILTNAAAAFSRVELWTVTEPYSLGQQEVMSFAQQH